MRSLYTALSAVALLTCSTLPIAHADDDETKTQIAMFEAARPCIETIRDGKDPTSKELDKCYKDLAVAMNDPELNRDLALLLIGAYWQGYDKITAKIAKIEGAAELPEINAQELVKAFKGNELAANKQYKDKELVVSGVVHSIDVNFGKASIAIQGDQFGLQNVRAHLNKDQEEAASQLQKGQKIKIKGVCDGLSFMDVSLQDAVIL